MNKPTPDLDQVDVSAEREFALHLARRILNQASQALMDGKAGGIRIPRVDPGFGAVAGRSLQLLTDRLDQIRISAPSRIEGEHNSPDVRGIRAMNKEKHNE